MADGTPSAGRGRAPEGVKAGSVGSDARLSGARASGLGGASPATPEDGSSPRPRGRRKRSTPLVLPSSGGGGGSGTSPAPREWKDSSDEVRPGGRRFAGGEASPGVESRCRRRRRRLRRARSLACRMDPRPPRTHPTDPGAVVARELAAGPWPGVCLRTRPRWPSSSSDPTRLPEQRILSSGSSSSPRMCAWRIYTTATTTHHATCSLSPVPGSGRRNPSARGPL